jgi:hypothetical protein
VHREIAERALDGQPALTNRLQVRAAREWPQPDRLVLSG